MGIRKVIIFGCGGFGREVLDTVRALQRHPGDGSWEALGFVDSRAEMAGRIINGLPVLGGETSLLQASEDPAVHAVLAFADASARKDLVTRLGERVRWATLIHPTAIISDSARVGLGSIVQAFSLVAANAHLGDHCILNAHSGLGHDVKVGDFSSIMSQCDVAGAAQLGEGVYMGTGARVIPSVRLGAHAHIGAGTVVFKDAGEGAKLLGNPARQIG